MVPGHDDKPLTTITSLVNFKTDQIFIQILVVLNENKGGLMKWLAMPPAILKALQYFFKNMETKIFFNWKSSQKS